MKPMLIIPPGALSKEDIEKLNANDICTVESQDPTAIKFVDPIPSATNRNEIENAAVEMLRTLIGTEWWSQFTDRRPYRSNVLTLYVECLARNSPLDPKQPSRADMVERERKIFDAAKDEEIREIAREEAREERAAKRAAKAKKK